MMNSQDQAVHDIALLLAKLLGSAIANKKPTVTPASELTYHFPKSGRLASLLLHDWYAGIATTEQAPLPPCSSLRGLRRTANMPEDHDFIRLPSQSSQEWDSNQVISCICKYCRYHFVFTVDTTPDQRQKQKQSGHLEHHFVVTDLHSVTEEDHTADQNKYKPLTRQTAYECSLCGTVAQVSMLRPRLQNKWIELITDQDRIHRSFRLAQKNDPERYADATPEKEAQWASTALTTLSAYLKNILNDDGTSQRKRISARNKTFTVQFGEDCEPIFEYLGFEKKEEDGELYWLQPRLPPRGNRTLLWSERAFFEDVRSEVQSILENSKSSANQPMVRAISSGRESLTKALGCEFPKGKTRLNPQYVHVRLLGVPDAADDEILQYAYSRQVAVDGEHRRQYIDALGNICQASNRSGELQVYVTTERDLDERMRREQQSTPDPLLASYARLNIEEINFKEPQMIIAQFRSLVHLNQSLTWEHSPRSDLLEIAKFLNNEQLRCEAFDYEMRHEEACLFFRLQTTTDLRSIYNVVNSLVSRSSSEEIDHLHLAAKALNPILENRERCEGGSEYLRLLVDIQENLWNGLNGSSLSPLYLTEQDVEMVGGAAPDSTSPTPALPPGLTNIGNTCYLNSILQYCYSLAEIRNYAQSCSQSSDEEISSWLRQGGLLSLGREAERNRAYLGFQCARELGLLFQQMESTRAKFIRPRQELANVVLISPHAKPSQRPPLPPRNTVSNSANATDAADISLPSDIIENLETASNASSETLVGLADADDEASTIKIRDGKSEDAVENSTQPAAPVAPTAGVSTEFTLEELDTQIKKQATGTGQMDVDEILSRILDHLQATMQLTPVTKGEDLVEKAFYSKDAHWQKVGDLDWVRTTPTIRFHNAIPAESGSRSLEDALAADLGLSGNEHFVAISTIDVPSPILPILISRSQHQGGESMKNSQPIRIPHELVLDRFMYGSENRTEFNAKKWSLNLSQRLNEVEKAVTSETELATPDDSFFVIEEADLSDPADDYEVIDRPNPEGEDSKPALLSASNSEELWQQFLASEQEEKKQLLHEQQLSAQEANISRKETYRLHAVFCHRGPTATSGHYWVWLYDFDCKTWYEYNDDRVKVVNDEEVEKVLQNSPDPSYLSYVRASEARKIVSFPTRRQASDGNTDTQGHAETRPDVDMEELEGVEVPGEVDMRDALDSSDL